MLRFSLVLPFAALLLGAAGLVACGGDDDDAGATAAATPTTAARAAASPTTAPPATAPTTAPAQGGTRVNIVDFGYGPDALTAKVGQPVSLTVVNGGQAPHTFTIAGVVDTGTLATGQSRTISFMPTAAGELQFLCTIHGATAMSGKVTVTP